MDVSNKLHRLWPYLPAFRAVAETEHLPTAAAQLHIVPSAVSRQVRLLEESIGGPLFSRTGRRLALNARGRALLDAVQRAMRAVEGGASASGAGLEGELRVGTLGVLTNHVVLPVLLDFARAHPGVVPVMKNYRATEANHRLVLGDLDLAFYTDAVPLSGVSFRRLGALSNAVYCGRGHPLFAARSVSRRQVLEHSFSVPSIGDRNLPMDGWPVDVERRVAFRIELLVTNLEVSRSGRFLTVLPDVVAAPHLGRGELRRLAPDWVPDMAVYGAWRTGEEDAPANGEILAAAEAQVARIGRRPRPR